MEFSLRAQYLSMQFRNFALAAVAASILASCSDGAGPGGMQMPAPMVDVVTLEAQELELKSTLTGRVTAYRTAEIRPQVSGIIQKRLFEEGSLVEEGAALYQIDPAPYRAALANAEGELAIAEANEENAKLRANRYEKLAQSKSVSQQDLDEAQANERSAVARVQAARAGVEAARINLAYTTINAPIRGVIGRSSATEGALVTAQQSVSLATIHQLSPVYVDVQRPAAELIRYAKQGDAAGTEVVLELDDGTIFPEVGELKFSESSVDMGTGMVNVRAEFLNAERLLLPGMFARATLTNQRLEQAILVPQQGISRRADGTATAFVVSAENTVEARTVNLAQAINNTWLIRDGLSEGERVIISGLQKIQPGISVQVRDASAADTGKSASAEEPK